MWNPRAANVLELLAFWRGVPLLQKTVVVMLCAMVLAGHLLRRDRLLFPLTRWGMYDTVYEPDVMTAFALYGVTAAGERVHINIAQTVPPLRGPHAPVKFNRTVQQLERTGAPDAARLVDDVASSVARLAAELDHTRFIAVEIVREAIHRDAPGVYRRSTQLFRTVPLQGSTPTGRR